MINDYNKLADELLTEPEFREGGFVYKHVKEAKSDALVSIRSAVDRMSDLYDLERNDIGIVSDILLKRLTDN
jgi:hypothetical protein|tara:strand:- start:1379 stop:1594 length:216 start_codon:yes stop_codon:yes gene_type:complete